MQKFTYQGPYSYKITLNLQVSLKLRAHLSESLDSCSIFAPAKCNIIFAIIIKGRICVKNKDLCHENHFFINLNPYSITFEELIYV